MKKCSIYAVLAAGVMMMSALSPVRGDDRPAGLRRIHEGMTPALVVRLIGPPTQVTPNHGGDFKYLYRDPRTRKVWVINFEGFRVDSIEDAND